MPYSKQHPTRPKCKTSFFSSITTSLCVNRTFGGSRITSRLMNSVLLWEASTRLNHAVPFTCAKRIFRRNTIPCITGIRPRCITFLRRHPSKPRAPKIDKRKIDNATTFFYSIHKPKCQIILPFTSTCLTTTTMCVFTSTMGSVLDQPYIMMKTTIYSKLCLKTTPMTATPTKYAFHPTIIRPSITLRTRATVTVQPK